MESYSGPAIVCLAAFPLSSPGRVGPEIGWEGADGQSPHWENREGRQGGEEEGRPFLSVGGERVLSPM